jgi:DNA-binding CsgD family transcriptional regulator
VLLIVYAIYYVRKRIRQKQQRLEEEKNLQLHKQQMVILQLENEKTQFELRQKSQELSNMLLTELNRKELSTNILLDVRRAMDLINGGHLEESKLRLQALQNRLASDANISPDWKRFEENFDIVNNQFLAKIKELYPWMNKQERRLCVYIKMGLMTKEIAPLMNLSTRSVEMMRYRLRDKMQLDRQANLKQYFEQL